MMKSDFLKVLLEKLSHGGRHRRRAGHVTDAEQLQHSAEQRLVLVHGGGTKAGLNMRAYEHSHYLASAIGEICINGFVKGDDKHAVAELGTVDDGVDIRFQPRVGRCQ